MSMFNKLKVALTNKQDQNELNRKKSIDLQFIDPEQVKKYKNSFEEIKNSIADLQDICTSNLTEFKQYVKERQEEASKQGKGEQDQEFTFAEDMEEIKVTLSDVIMQIGKLQVSEQEIKQKLKVISTNESPQKMKELQQIIVKQQLQLKALRSSDQNSKMILQTLQQQTQLLTKQTKQIQDKNIKLQKDLGQKNHLLNNLKEEKLLLLEMRNNDSETVNPEIQLLKNQVADLEKKLALQRTRLQQKEKEIQVLKKKMEEDRESLEKIADQLKEKELKSKKIIDKYERSKTEIRKYREEKTDFIKKLNLEIANLSEKLQTTEAHNKKITEDQQNYITKIDNLETEISKNQSKAIELDSAQGQLKDLRKEQLSYTIRIAQKEQQLINLKQQNDQLQSKRKSLLEALEKPINHQMKTLNKIIHSLQKLYKDYISIVFEEGNIVGFENRITYILSNVVEIKEDLLL